ncbi:hypothetical protein PV04_10728 [Phialophora macrospora]|uniref:Uncharacterized protein n=1 Tax=Phialophora macrospora TaxID=1851006 RepID=A0A0D2CC09_9EURO|nr:hypothetical protein PV04_10728 [Phialophora macrospora]
MGANTSKIGTGLAFLPGEVEAPSTRPIGQQQPSPSALSNNPPTQVSRISARNGSLQIVSTPPVQGSPRVSSTARGHGSTRATIPESRQQSMNTASLPPNQASAPAPSLLRESSASKLSTHTRPLPPVESRETVRSQAARITRWAIIDGSSEIYESCQIGDSAQLQSDVDSLARLESGTKVSDLDTRLAPKETHIVPNIINSSPSADSLASHSDIPFKFSVLPLVQTSAPSDTVPVVPCQNPPTTSVNVPVTKPKKKRRLIPTARAVEIATGDVNNTGNYPKTQSKDKSQTSIDVKKSEYGFVNLFPDGFDLSPEEEWLLPDPHPGSCLYQDLDHEDKDYWSQILNAAKPVDGESLEEQEQRRLKLLERFHDLSASVRSAQAQKPSPTELSVEDLLLKQAREYMLKEQEAGAERSRRLREKALRRRGLLAVPSSSSSSEQDKTFSDGQAEDSSASDLFSDNDGDVQMEDLLDLAQEYATKDLKAVQPKAQDTVKTIHRKTNLAGPNALSREAAEQFRTQSRHLSGCNHKPCAPASRSQPLSGAISGSHLSPHGLALAERAQRLREAKKRSPAGSVDAGTRAKDLTLGDGSTRCDVGSSRPLPNLASSLSQLARERQEKKPGAGPRNRSLIDRISNTRNIDEDYDEEGDEVATKGRSEGTTTTRSRPLSGFELLAAKKKAQDDHNDDNQCIDEITGVPYRPNDISVSGLQMLAAKKAALEGDTLNPERPTFAPTASRTSATKYLTLPKNFNQLAETEKEVILQHEIAKEKKRDLDIIGSVFWESAQLLCFPNRELTDRTMQTETEELHDIGGFIGLVIDQNKCGKVKRKRIQDIRDNIKRRIEKAARYAPEPTEATILKEMKRTFRPEHVDFVHNELPKVQKLIDHWGDLRRSGRGSRKTTRKRDSQKVTSRKQVRFADEEESAAVYSFPSQSSKPPKPQKALKGSGCATENRRQAQHDHQDRLEAKLRAQLKLFETADADEIADIQTQVAETQAEIERIYRDGESDSEEEDGAEFVFGAGLDVKKSRLGQDINEINSLKDARQKESGLHTPQWEDQGHQAPGQSKLRQSFDPELLRQMQLNRAKQLAQVADPSIVEDKATAVALDSDTDDETAASSDDEDEDDDRRVCKYIVWGAHRGFANYEDADHYRITATYDKDRAEKKVREHIISVQGQLPPGTVFDAGNWSCNTVYQDGLLEQHLMLGADVDYEARVWIEKELVRLGEKRFKQAKRRHAVIERFTYKVYWEKTVTPVLAEGGEVAERVTENSAMERQSDGYDELFGSSASPEPSREEPETRSRDAVVTEISRDEIEARTFSCAVYANRDAKDVFLAWYYTFLSGFANEGYRRQEDESMEQTLEALGDWGLFDRSETLRREEAGGADGATGKVDEKFRVWVKKIAVKGPGN